MAGMTYNQDLRKNHMPVLCWGHKNIPKSTGITSYTIAPNRIGLHVLFWTKGGHWNVLRRCRGQALYVVPPLLGAWWLMDWAHRRNEYLNSKRGRMEADEDG